MNLIYLTVSSEAQPAKKDSKKKTDNNGIKKKKTRYLTITLLQIEYNFFKYHWRVSRIILEQPWNVIEKNNRTNWSSIIQS